jgi:hypothetical protein
MDHRKHNRRYFLAVKYFHIETEGGTNLRGKLGQLFWIIPKFRIFPIYRLPFVYSS